MHLSKPCGTETFKLHICQEISVLEPVSGEKICQHALVKYKVCLLDAEIAVKI